jgi:hypothetical protein
MDYSVFAQKNTLAMEEVDFAKLKDNCMRLAPSERQGVDLLQVRHIMLWAENSAYKKIILYDEGKHKFYYGKVLDTVLTSSPYELDLRSLWKYVQGLEV